MQATERYQALIDGGLIQADVNQLAALTALDSLGLELAARRHWSGGRRGLFRRRHWEDPPKGYYLWGGVGRGKTFLMDLFVDSLPPNTALRLHFHRFMSMVHGRLTALQGTVDPLEAIADELARKHKVLCFDECFVSDITDAMVLGTLFSALFRRGVALVTTSNIVPDGLYKSDVLSTFPKPTCDFVTPDTVPVNVGFEIGAYVVEATDESSFAPTRVVRADAAD